MNAQTENQTAESRELELYTTNDYGIYSAHITSAIKILRGKIKAGKYDAEKACKLFFYVATAGAKKYAREFFDNGTPYYKVFTAACRRETAKHLLDYYMDAIMDE